MNIIKILDDYLLKEANKEYIIETHWPSNASCVIDNKVIGKCLRAQSYGWKGIQPSNPFSIDTLWTFLMGKAIHFKLQEKFENMDIETETEKKAEAGFEELKYLISGYIDLLFEFKETWHGIEIKSTYGRAIVDPVTGIRYRGPMKHHLCQVLPYMIIKNCDFYILYVARDTGWRESFHLEYDPSLDDLRCEGKATGVSWRGILDRWQELEIYLEKGEAPPRDYQLSYSDDYWKKQWDKYKETTRAKKPMTLNVYKKDKNTGLNKGDWECLRCLYRDYCYSENELNKKTTNWVQRQGL